MARKQTKKVQTIQSTIDTYAAGIVRRGVLEKQVQKNEFGIGEAGKVLTAHVRAQNAGQVAYHAKNGLTLLVSPSDSWSPIRTVQPGKLEIEQREPATAAIADDVASLLARGAATEAQALIDSALGGDAINVGPNSKAKTATELQRDWAAAETRVMAHWYRLAFPRLYGVDFAKREPAIEQQTCESATMGPIRLSKRAKELLVENRKAIQRAIGSADYNAQGMIVSKSRGRIAQYISELEQRVNKLQAQIDDNYATRA